MKILVADDTRDITDMVRDMLESSGYACTTANSGQECLDLIRANTFDLVLLDVAMPQITGIDVLAKVKEDNIPASNRIVFFTASSLTEHDKNKLRDLGALDCLSKPLTRQKLLQVITKYAA